MATFRNIFENRSLNFRPLTVVFAVPLARRLPLSIATDAAGDAAGDTAGDGAAAVPVVWGNL